jgi:hypothetical protein
VVISDRTPWLSLESSASGWCVPLESPDRWRSTLQGCVDMHGESYDCLAHGAQSFAATWVELSKAEVRAMDMFRDIVEQIHARSSAP